MVASCLGRPRIKRLRKYSQIEHIHARLIWMVFFRPVYYTDRVKRSHWARHRLYANNTIEICRTTGSCNAKRNHQIQNVTKAWQKEQPTNQPKGPPITTENMLRGNEKLHSVYFRFFLFFGNFYGECYWSYCPKIICYSHLSSLCAWEI